MMSVPLNGASATWLLTVLPSWYVSAVGVIGESWPFALPSIIGLTSLLIGIILTIRRRDRRLWRFAILFVLSELLVASAGLLRGYLKAGAGAMGVGVAVVLIQLALGCYWTVRLKGSRPAALALTIFSLTYALFAAFVAAMSFSDSWM